MCYVHKHVVPINNKHVVPIDKIWLGKPCESLGKSLENHVKVWKQSLEKVLNFKAQRVWEHCFKFDVYHDVRCS